MVRAKFKCVNNEKTDNGYTIKLEPVVSGSSENESFYKYTPWGQIVLGTVNDNAAEKFLIGRSYYVDFTDAEPYMNTDC